MAEFKARDKLDSVFEISIILKALDGLLETAGGILLLFLSPASINHVVRTLTNHELSEDPHDFIATHILHSTHAMMAGGSLFLAVYLLAHGLSKIWLVVEILRGRLWAYKGIVVLLGAFIVYQLYRIALAPSSFLVLLTIFDAFIVVLTIIEYRRHTRHRKAKMADDEPKD